MSAEEKAPETPEEWHTVLQHVAERLRESSAARAVLVVIAQADWMEKESDVIAGIAGTTECNSARLAQHLRDMARLVEGQAANIAAGAPFEASQPFEEKHNVS